jgi:hypothetical protein
MTAVAELPRSSAAAVRSTEIRWVTDVELKRLSLGCRVVTAGSVLPSGDRGTGLQAIAR